MVSLREAAERALEVLLDYYSRADEVADAVKNLREALENEESNEYEEGFRAGLEAAKNAIVEVEERA